MTQIIGDHYVRHTIASTRQREVEVSVIRGGLRGFDEGEGGRNR